MGQVGFPHPEQRTAPCPGYRDCTIAFKNCKSFLPKRNCRQTASFDTTRRQLTIRSNQTKGSGFLNIVFTSATPGLCNKSKNSLISLCCCISKSKRKTAAGHRNNVYTLLDLMNPEVYRDLTPPEELPLFIGDELPL